MSDVKPSHNSEDVPGLIAEPRQRGWVWLVYAVLFALAIPWYWPAGYRGPLLLGIPLWAATTIVCVVLLAMWTTWVIVRYWQDEGD